MSMATLAEPMTSAGVMTADEAARLAARPGEPDFLGCGFAHIGVWGRRTAPPARARPIRRQSSYEPIQPY
jgi:hypothetical protein